MAVRAYVILFSVPSLLTSMSISPAWCRPLAICPFRLCLWCGYRLSLSPSSSLQVCVCARVLGLLLLEAPSHLLIPSLCLHLSTLLCSAGRRGCASSLPTSPRTLVWLISVAALFFGRRFLLASRISVCLSLSPEHTLTLSRVHTSHFFGR